MPDTPPRGYKALQGSERKPLADARPIGPVDPNERLEVSVYLKAPATSEVQQINQGQRLTREEYSKSHSASPEAIAKIEQFAHDHNLTVVEVEPLARKIVLAGTVAAMTNAFKTQLHHYEAPGGKYRGRTGPLHVPDDLDQIIEGVFGLDDRPQSSPHIRRCHSRTGAEVSHLAYTLPQLSQAYNFPTNVNGNGQCIAIIELGGGFRQSDLQTYFQQLNITPPTVISVSVDGASNQPVGTPDSADGEVDLDIEVAGAVAPGARIAVYFAPNTDRGFLDAITQATHDSTNNPSVISISWGSAEVDWTAQAMQAMNRAFQDAVALGITVCCAAGDNGSSDGVTDGKSHVDFPASSPYALACGGTRLEANGSTITSEVVWNDGPNSATGGGVSDFFDLPTWQTNANVPPSANGTRIGRGVPDIAGVADPQTGYVVYVDGQRISFGGTSAVAPLWAGLIALINQQRGRSLGYLNPILYQNYNQLAQANALHDITDGNNGSYSARSGWDACTGLGTPNGENLLKALQTATPSTASIP
jgi:kumamolisin